MDREYIPPYPPLLFGQRAILHFDYTTITPWWPIVKGMIELAVQYIVGGAERPIILKKRRFAHLQGGHA